MKTLELIKPLDYQIEPIGAIRNALMTNNEVLCVMATGLGKTIVSAFIVKELLNMGYRGIFLCHQNYILEQAEKTYREVVGNHIKYRTFYGEEKHWDADTAQMLFAGFKLMNSYHGEWYKVFDPNHFDFMVVDEGHHGAASTYRAVIDYFNCKKLGLTGTPDREDDKDIHEIFGKEIVNIPLEVGIVNGWLADMEYHILSDGLSNRKLKAILRRVLKKNERVSVKQINESIFISNRTDQQRLVIEEYNEIKNRTQGKKTMIFCENIDHAEHVVEYFDRAGGVIHSKRSAKENHEILTEFRTGELQYLISVDKMNEGIDVPDVEVVVFLRATDSKRIFLQQLGRGARKIPGKKKLIILDFVANVDRLLMIREMMDRIELEVEKDKELKGKLTKRNFNVSGVGFEFIFSDTLVDLLKVLAVLNDGFYKTWEEASKVCIEAGVKDPGDYRKRYQKISFHLPSRPVNYKEWPGWPEFLGKKVAPEGWMTANKLGKEKKLIAKSNTIKKFVIQYRRKHPEWFKVYWSRYEYLEHYHPDLVKLIKKEFSRKKRKPAPKGWLTAEKVSNEKGMIVKTQTISEFVIQYRRKHPEWFKKYIVSTKFVEHYHPDLVQKIRFHFFSRQRPPKGWLTANGVCAKSKQKLSSTTVAKFVDSFRRSNPEWFKDYIAGVHLSEHYHPDLVKKAILRFKRRKKAPKGWVTPNVLVLKFGIGSRGSIETFVGQYRKKHENWFNNFVNKGNMNCEYYHPDLVKLIKKEFNARKVPKGWITLTKLVESRIVRQRYSAIRLFVDQYRDEHSKWFKIVHSKDRKAEYYHPDLVKIIKAEFARKK